MDGLEWEKFKWIDLPQGTYYYMLKIASKKSNGPVSRLSDLLFLKDIDVRIIIKDLCGV